MSCLNLSLRRTQSYVGCRSRKRNPFAPYKLNTQPHANLPTQQLQQNLNSAFSIGGVLNDGDQAIKRTTTNFYLLSRPQLRPGLNYSFRVGLLPQKIYDPFIERDRFVAETDDALHARGPTNIMKFRREMNPDKQIIRKERDDSFSFFCYSDKIEAREKNLEILHAQMKLCLFLSMWFTINHIPISR